MMSNVNSFSTNTALPQSLMQLQQAKLWRSLRRTFRCPSATAAAERESRHEVDAKRMSTLKYWWLTCLLYTSDAADE